MSQTPQRCTSRIERVILHAEGVRVVRHIEPPQRKQDGEQTYIVDDITALALPNSFRASCQGVELVALQSHLQLPTPDDAPSDNKRQIDALNLKLKHANEVKSRWSKQRKSLQQAVLVPGNAKAWNALGPQQRIEDALLIDNIVDQRLQRIDEHLAQVNKEIETLERERDRLNLQWMQRSSHEDRQATWQVEIRCAGQGTVEALTIEYVVMEARWWPLYTLHFADGGRSARLLIEAMIAQDTREDWVGVHVDLSTADLTFDARLPQLPALKLGKKQISKSTGFREPPTGTSRLFQSYDAAMIRLNPDGLPTSKPTPPGSNIDAMIQEFDAPAALGAIMYDEEVELEAKGESFARASLDFEDDDMDGFPMPQAAPAGMPMAEMTRAMPKSRSILPSFGGGLFESQGAPMPEESRKRSAAPARPAQTQTLSMEPEVQGLSPEEQWLNFDELIMSKVTDLQRGQLIIRSAPTVHIDRSSMARVITRAQELQLIDPATSRGHYDHRYHTDGTLDVPSDATLHRVDVVSASADAKLWWRSVPHEEETVYRMAKLLNPHETPLLQGPVDVFIEGSFLLNTTFKHIDRGGEVIIGLGQDERIKVARNATMDEARGGLINNKTVIEQSVDIEVTSGLGFTASVEVLDRLPVTYSDDVSIEHTHITPSAEDYDQKDIGPAIEGGKRWWLTVPAGQTKHIQFSYTVTISAKEELVGGNRRE